MTQPDTSISAPEDGSATLQELATKATKDIAEALMQHFQEEGKDKSYRRAMFRQNNEYGCTMVIDVHLIDYDKSAHIITRFGAKP